MVANEPKEHLGDILVAPGVPGDPRIAIGTPTDNHNNDVGVRPRYGVLVSSAYIRFI